MGPEARPEREIHAKYLDWCSGRITERLMALSPAQAFHLADRADAGPLDPGLLVARIVDELQLPTFDEWRVAYERDPASYDREMLGFWRGTHPGP